MFFGNSYICYINIDNTQFLQQCPHDPGRSSGHTDALWKELNLRGCFPILQEMYDIRLIKENAFLAIEIWVAITLLVEVALIAMSLAFVLTGAGCRRTCSLLASKCLLYMICP